MYKQFMGFANLVAKASGYPGAFAAAVFIVLTWILTGPLFGFSDSWQLIMNTLTNIITFLMVFLIPNCTKSRHSCPPSKNR